MVEGHLRFRFIAATAFAGDTKIRLILDFVQYYAPLVQYLPNR